MSGNEKAPDGTIWVCAACAKVARWRYGFDDANKTDPEASRGWEASCMLNAVLCHERKSEAGQWMAVAR